MIKDTDYALTHNLETQVKNLKYQLEEKDKQYLMTFKYNEQNIEL